MMKKYFFALIMIALTILAWVITYSHLPNELATHWGISGEADDFSKKPTAIATLVGIMIVQYILMVLIPKIDP